MSYSTHHSVQGSRLTQTVSFSSTACQPAPTWAGASSSGTTWNVWWSTIKIAVFCHILHELIQVATSVTTCNLVLCAFQVFHLDASFSCIVDKLFHLNNGITTSVPKRKFGSACWVLGLIITFPFGFWIEFDLDFFYIYRTYFATRPGQACRLDPACRHHSEQNPAAKASEEESSGSRWDASGRRSAWSNSCCQSAG